MLRTLLHFRNPDSTRDLIDTLAGFISRGIISGGTLVPVPGQLAIDVTPFKLMGFDGMEVIEDSDTERLVVVPNQVNVIVFKSEYIDTNNATADYEVIEVSAYNARIDKDFLTVYGTVTLGALDTQVAPNQIDYSLRDVVDPLKRLSIRGSLTSSALLPADPASNRPGDCYPISSGLGDVPAWYIWNGVNWVNVSDTLIVANLLNAHRNNLFSNEIHLTDDQAQAVLGTEGTPSSTNKFVTAQDTRLPTQAENDALAGSPTGASGTNPFVTANYVFAAPTYKAFSAFPAPYLTLAIGDGPVYVGKGGIGSANSWFRLFHATAERGFVDLVGTPSEITGVFKDTALTIPLQPSIDPAVDANGFCNGIALYLSFSGSLSLALRLAYGKSQTLSAIDRGVFLKTAPQDSKTSEEALQRMRDISGRLFDVSIPTNEQNIQLRASVNALRSYLNATTVGDIVVAATQLPRLQEIPEFAPDFPVVTLERTLLAGGTAFTVGNALADFQQVDGTLVNGTIDPGVVSAVHYSSLVGLSGVRPGHIFTDGIGTRFRILMVGTGGNGHLLIFTNGQAVSTTTNATSGAIAEGNNPRQIQFLDHSAMVLREILPVVGIVPDITGDFESLPPGGVSVGASPLFSLIGQSILPNMGAASGASAGRPSFFITPKRQDNALDSRVRLVGSWKYDAAIEPEGVIGQVSSGGCGIDFTGFITSGLTLFVPFTANMPYNLRVFVNGVYNQQIYPTGPTELGQNPSPILKALRVQDPSLQPISIPLTLAAGMIHNVRVEVTTDGTDPFVLYGLEVFYTGAVENAGRAFNSTDLVKIDTINTALVPNPANNLRGARYTRYIDRVTGLRTSAIRTMFINEGSPGPGVLGASATVPVPSIASAAQVGDVYYVSDKTSSIADASTHSVYRRAIALGVGTVTFDQGFTGFPALVTPRMELAYRIPCKTDGTPVVASPNTIDEVEYLRLTPADFDTGADGDIANLSDSAAEDRATTFDDGTTGMLVKGCQMATTLIEGYSEGISLAATTSFATVNAFCTRVDFLFCGNSGPVNVDIEIDGQYTYTVALRGDGLERHSAFFQASPQSHSVRVLNPSVAKRVIIGAVSLHLTEAQVTNGAVLSDWIAMKNATSATAIYDAAQTDINSAAVTSFAGCRVVDISKAHARFFDGSANNFNWNMVFDPLRNKRFGWVIQTDRQSGYADLDAYGSDFELYYEAGPDHGIATIYLNGVQANQTNFPTLLAISMEGGVTQYYNSTNGQLDCYSAAPRVRRLVLSNLPMRQYVITVQTAINGSYKNVSSTGYIIGLLAFAEQCGTGMVLRRNPEDTAPNKLHFSGFGDSRNFATLLGDQIGVAAAAEAAAAAATVATATSTGLADINVHNYFFGLYNDWSVDADAVGSPQSPAYVDQKFTRSSVYNSTQKSAQLSYDATMSYTCSTALGVTTVILTAAPDWVIAPADLEGQIFQPTGASNGGGSIGYKIQTAISTTQFQLEITAANVGSAEACAVKQCYHTKDLVQFSPGLPGQSQAASDRIPVPLPAELTGIVNSDIGTMLFDCEASTTSGIPGKDAVYGTPLVSFTANILGLRTDGTTPDTADNTGWSVIHTMPTYQEQLLHAVSPPTSANNQRLFLRVFPAPISGSGKVNVLRWVCMFFDDLRNTIFKASNFYAYGYTDGSTTPTNMSLSLISGKTRVTLTKPFDFGAFPGSPESDLEIFLDGKALPRLVAGVTYSDAYFTEVNSFSFDLDTDYSGAPLSIDVRYRGTQRTHLKIGRFSPLSWNLSGLVMGSTKPFDGPRFVYETRTFTKLRLYAFDTGSSGTTTVNVYYKGSFVTSISMPAGTAGNQVVQTVNLPSVVDDYYTVTCPSTALGCDTITVEMA